MNALYYTAPGQFHVKAIEVPPIRDDQILIKVSLSGMCGTDVHIHAGEFISEFPLVPGHEIVGTVTKVGSQAEKFAVGDRVVSDPGVTCGDCFYCRRGDIMMCESYHGIGVTMPGGFAEFVAVEARKAFKIYNMSDEEATLVEPLACAMHGLDKLKLRAGSEVLLTGAGPTGNLMAQLLRKNGARRLVIAAPGGSKLDLARKLNIADEYIELNRSDPQAQWDKLKKDNPYGFDAVIEATGAQDVINEVFHHVRKCGKLLVYGVYSHDVKVNWSPERIFRDEIEIMGSFAQSFCFPRAVAYLDNGELKTEGLISHVFGIDEYQKALDHMKSRQGIKIAIRPTIS